MIFLRSKSVTSSLNIPYHHTTNWIIVATIYDTIINNDYVWGRKFPADDSMKKCLPLQNIHFVDPLLLNFLLVLTHIRMDDNLNQFSFQISLIVIISFVVAPNFADRREKLKFRPYPEWFANMQPPADQSPSYFEQSDEPASENQFTDLFVDDYESDNESQFSGGSKVPRHPSMFPAVYQSLCPTKRIDVFLNNDFDYEYRPSSYVEVECEKFDIQ